MKPTLREYQDAKKIVEIYEKEQNRLEIIRLDDFKKDLEYLFLNNDKLIIKEFELEKNWIGYNIIPIDPDLEEMYEGELNNEIKILCDKHKINAHIVYKSKSVRNIEPYL